MLDRVKIRKKIKRIVIVTLSIAAFIFFINLVIDNPYSHRIARSIINDKVSAETSYSIDFKAIKLSAIPLGFELYGFSASGPDSEEPLFQANQIKGFVSLWSIIIGEPKLGTVEVKEPVFAFPWPGYKAEDDPKPDKSNGVRWPLQIENIPVETILVRAAKISVTLPPDKDGDIPLDMHLENTDIDLDITSTSQFDCYLNLGKVNIASFGLPILENSSIEADFIIEKQKIHKAPYRIRNKNVDIGGILQGNILRDKQKNIKGIEFKSDAKGKGNLKQLGRVFDIPDTYGDTTIAAEWMLSIDSQRSDPVELLVDAEGKTSDAAIGGFHLLDSAAKLRVDLDGITFNDIDIIKGDQNFGKAQGYLGFRNGMPFSFEGKPQNLPLTTLLNAIKVKFSSINSKVTSSNLIVKGRGRPFNIEANAVADFRELSFPQIKFPKRGFDRKPTCRIEVDIDVSGTQTTFGNSPGYCYIPSLEAKSDFVPSADPSPPIDALHQSPININGYATYSLKDGMDVRISSSKLDLTIFESVVQGQLSGIGKTLVKIAGPYDDVVVRASSEVDDAKTFNVDFGRVVSTVDYKNLNEIHWSGFRAEFEKDRFISSSTGQLTLNYDLSFSANLEAKDVPAKFSQQFLAAVPYPQDANFKIRSLKADLSGPLLVPFRQQGKIDLDLEKFVYKDNLWADRIRGRLLQSDKTATFSDLDIFLADLVVRSNATIDKSGKAAKNPYLKLYGLSEQDRLDLTSKSFVQRNPFAKSDPDHLHRIPILAPYFESMRLRGKLDIEMKAQGELGDLQGKLDTKIDSVSWYKSRLAPIDLSILLADRKVDATVNHSGNALEGRVSIDLSKDNLPYDWYFKANRVDLRSLGTRFFSDDPRNYAYLSADWIMKGELYNWWRSEGELNIQEFRAKFIRDYRGEVRDLSINHASPVTVDISPRGWNIRDDKTFYLEGDGINLKIDTYENSFPDDTNIAFEGTLDISILRNLYSEIETANGEVMFSGALKGNVYAPDLSIVLRNTDSKMDLGLSSFRPALTDINMLLRYEESTFYLDRFNARKGKGQVSGNGFYSLSKDVEDSRMDFSFKNAAIVYPIAVLKSFDTEISGSVAITGNSLPIKVSGDITIDRARSTRQFDIRDEIVQALQRKSYTVQLVPKEPMLDLDLRINAEDTISIRNRNIQANLSTNLNIKGSEQAPVLVGQVEVTQGNFAYKYRRDFRITQGLITFDDPVKPDPRLDILGVNEVDSYRIYLAITGRASNPRVDLSADPPTREDGTPLTKVDILLLLSNGSLPDRQRSDLATQDTARAEALNILVGQVEEPVEKLFDLSGQEVVQQVYIDTYAEDGELKPRLNFPLNLHQDWDVIFRVEGDNMRVSLGYDVHESISISGNVDRQREEQSANAESPTAGTDTGVDLKFRFSFP